jgi:hypothetical protein
VNGSAPASTHYGAGGGGGGASCDVCGLDAGDGAAGVAGFVIVEWG